MGDVAHRRAVRRVWLLFCAVVVVVLVGDALVLWHHLAGAPHGFGVWVECSVVSPAAAGTAAVILAHLPGHRMGRIYAAVAAAGALQLLTGSVAALGSMDAIPHRLAVVCAHVQGSAANAVVFLLAIPALVFPDGRPLTRRWRPVVVAAVVLVVITFLIDPLIEYAGDPPYPLHNRHSTTVRIAEPVLSALMLVIVGAAVLSMVLRWRRGDRVTRQQVKWVAAPTIFGVVLILGVAPLLFLAGVNVPGQVGDFAWAFTTASLPIGTAVAIVRFRLYDIDRIVSKTLGYALVTGLLVGVYVGLVAAGSALTPSRYGSIGVAVATLAVAALFVPVRRRVQSMIDRRFNRSRFDAQRIVDSFAGRVRGQADPDGVGSDLLSVLERTVQPAVASVWLR